MSSKAGSSLMRTSRTPSKPTISRSPISPITPKVEKAARISRTPTSSSGPIEKGELPQVSFYKPLGVFNGHPDYSDLAAGDAHVADVVARLRKSPNWADMLIIVTADENGGFWDHVAPPRRDRFGPGVRVPTLIISPFAKKGFVDKTVYDTLSVLRTIELRFGVAPLSERDARATDLRNALVAP